MRSWCGTAQPFARIRLDLVDDSGAELRVEALLPGRDAPKEVRKRVLVNGLPRRVGSLGEVARTVLFRPEEMLLLVGSPSERRRFLDGILTQRSRRTARDLAELSRILAQRNALLRAIRREEATEEGLGFWDEQLAQAGGRVTAARLALVGEVAERIGPLHDAVAPPSERADRVRLAYADSLKDAWPGRADGTELGAIGPRGDRRGARRGIPATPGSGAPEGALERSLAGWPAA